MVAVFKILRTSQTLGPVFGRFHMLITGLLGAELFIPNLTFSPVVFVVHVLLARLLGEKGGLTLLTVEMGLTV